MTKSMQVTQIPNFDMPYSLLRVIDGDAVMLDSGGDKER